MNNALKTAFKYIKQRKINELILTGRLFAEYYYGDLKYNTVSKISRNRYKIVTVNGSKMYIYLDDNGISKELYLYKRREKFATEFMESFLSEDDIIIEIGANIGYYVLLESKIAKKGKIYACEPMPLNRKLLEMNVKLNNVKNIELYPFAMGDQNKEQQFYIYDKINWSSFNKNIDGKIVSTVSVKTITIDNFINEYLDGCYPTVLRMDVEGYEYNIIKGALNMLRHCDNLKIFMEIHPHLLSPEKLDELINIFKDNKFKVRALINECFPHFYPYLNHKSLNSIIDIPYGCIGNSYEELKKYLYVNKGTEVFFEKN
jgi:FkbM family methyltransferase